MGYGDSGIGGGGLSSRAGLGAAGSAAGLSSAGDGRAPARDRGDGAPVGGVLLQALGGGMVWRRLARGGQFFFFLSRDLVSGSLEPNGSLR